MKIESAKGPLCIHGEKCPHCDKRWPQVRHVQQCEANHQKRGKMPKGYAILVWAILLGFLAMTIFQLQRM